jgi:hypothetical protein
MPKINRKRAAQIKAELLASCYTLWTRAEAEIARNGIIFQEFDVAEDGELIPQGIKVNPALRVRSDALRQMRSLLTLA